MPTFMLWAAMAYAGAALGPGDHPRSIEVDGVERTYLVHVPPKYDPAQKTPVVFIFHGMAGDAPAIVRISGMSKKADEVGFIVVYPEGSGSPNFRTFKAGERRGPEPDDRPDDVAFVRALLDLLPSLVHVDSSRVYAAGISNGGMLCYRLAALLPDRFAAIASIAGPVTTDERQTARPIPVLHFHGTADRVVPIAGPAKGTPDVIYFESAEETIRRWCTINGCEGPPRVVEEPDRAKDGTRVTHKFYSPKKGNADVELVLIEGGGHTWPGQPPQFPFAGRSTRDVHANDIIWDFFSRHPKEANSSTPSVSNP